MYCKNRGSANLALAKKNTKNWYAIDALGAIFAIFDTSDNFDTLNKV